MNPMGQLMNIKKLKKINGPKNGRFICFNKMLIEKI